MDLRDLRNRVAGTKAFSGMDYIQKRFVLKLKNLQSVAHCMEVIENRGIDYCLKVEKPMYLNKMIITELYKNGNK